MAHPSTHIASTKHRLVMTPRRWATLSAICFLAAAYYLCYEHFPVHVTKDTPLYRATRNGKQGIVTTGGRIVVPFEWDEIGAFDDHGMALVSKMVPAIGQSRTDLLDEIRGVVDRSGNYVIPATLTFSADTFDDSGELVGVRDQHLVSFDRQGRERRIADCLPLVSCDFGSSGLLAVRKGRDTAWINRSGQVVLKPPAGLSVRSNFDECGLALVSNHQELVGCINEHGTIVIPAEWRSIEFVSNNVFRPGKSDSKQPVFVEVTKAPASDSSEPMKGLYSSLGQCIIPACFLYLNVCYEPNMICGQHLDGSYRCMDFGGNELSLPQNIEYQEPRSGFELLLAKQNGKTGWLNQLGQVAIPFEFDDVWANSDFADSSFAVVAKNSKWGVIDSSGHVVIPCEFDRIEKSLIQRELFVATKNELKGCVNTRGETVVPFEFTRLGETATQRYFVGSRSEEDVVFDDEGKSQHPTNGLMLSCLSSVPDNSDTSKGFGVFRCNEPLFAARHPNSAGLGVFHATRGLIVATVHHRMTHIGNGLLGSGLMRFESTFNQHANFIIQQLSEWMPSVVPPSHAVCVIYDLDGNIIWRNDARLIDLLKAFGLSCWGLYCFRRYRVVRREQRELQAGC